MALIKTPEQREVEMQQKVEYDLEHRERREKIHHILIAGLGAMVLAAFVGGHFSGRHCARRRRIL